MIYGNANAFHSTGIISRLTEGRSTSLNENHFVSIRVFHNRRAPALKYVNGGFLAEIISNTVNYLKNDEYAIKALISAVREDIALKAIVSIKITKTAVKIFLQASEEWEICLKQWKMNTPQMLVISDFYGPFLGVYNKSYSPVNP